MAPTGLWWGVAQGPAVCPITKGGRGFVGAHKSSTHEIGKRKPLGRKTFLDRVSPAADTVKDMTITTHPWTRRPGGARARGVGYAAVCAGAAIALAGCQPAVGAAPRGAAPGATVTFTGVVVRIADGDTITVRARGFADTRVRLVGIDTPETHGVTQCGGPEATRFTTSRVPVGSRVVVASDPTQAVRDRYDRFLGVVTREGRAVSVNQELVAAGWARVYIYRGVPFTLAPVFLAAESRARAGRRGVWGPACSPGR